MFEDQNELVINILQNSLRTLRHLAGVSLSEMSDLTGIGEQELLLLEKRAKSLSKTKAVALLSAMEFLFKQLSDCHPVVFEELNRQARELGCQNDIFTNGELDTLLFVKKANLSEPLTELASYGEYKVESSSVSSAFYQNLADNYRIFMDETFLLEPANQVYLTPLSEQMSLFDNKYIVPLKAVNILKELYANGDKHCLDFLLALQERQLLDLRGGEGESTLSALLISIMVKLKSRMKLALITQNEKLARQISSLNCNEIGGYDILLLHCSAGELRPWDFLTAQPVEAMVTPVGSVSAVSSSDVTADGSGNVADDSQSGEAATDFSDRQDDEPGADIMSSPVEELFDNDINANWQEL